MIKVYFVRHAQPEYAWEDDRTRPLTAEGKNNAKKVLEFLKDKNIDKFYCSPYMRSVDTIAETAEYYGKEIITDERLREREKGPNGNIMECFKNVGLIMIFMKKAVNPLQWYRKEISLHYWTSFQNTIIQ